MRQRNEVFGTRAKRGRGRRLLGSVLAVSALMVGGLAGFGPDRAKADPANGVAGAPRVAAGKLNVALTGGTCAVRPSGRVRCWGTEGTVGKFVGASLDVDAAIGENVTQISMDDTKMCALTDAGAIKCYGDPGAGAAPSLPPGTATMLTVGSFGYCYLTPSGGVRCSGNNVTSLVFGVINWTGGSSTTTDVPFTNVPVGTTVTAVAASDTNTCALLSTGGVRCWGLGPNPVNGGSTRGADISGLPPLDSFAISATYGTGCGVATATKMVHCWGKNSPSPATPLPVGPATSLSIKNSGCAVLVSGGITCWPPAPSRDVYSVTLGPDQNGNPAVAVAVAVGINHTCATLTTDEVRCWGAPEQTGGSSETVSVVFGVPLTIPDTSIVSGPAAGSTIATPSATFAFSASPAIGASFECALDTAPFAACTSPVSVSGLVDGTHTYKVRATNAAGTDPTPAERSFTVSLPVAPLFTASSPPLTGTVGSPYSYTFVASGVPSPVFAVESGSLPAGVSLTSAGVLSGSPTAAGSSTFMVSATNSAGTVSAGPFTIVVSPAPVAPLFTASSPPLAGTVGSPYSYTFTASGVPVPVFAVESGSLPAGVSLTSAGVLSGLPTAAGSSTFVVSATNSAGTVNSASITIVVTAVSDTTKPTVLIVTPTPNQTFPASPILITGTATDNTSVTAVKLAIYRGVDGGQFWNGTTWQTAYTTVVASLSAPNTTSTTWTYSFVSPPGGYFGAIAVAFDANENFEVAPFRPFRVADAIVPTVEILSPTAAQAIPAKPVTITGFASDNVGILDVQLFVYRPVASGGEFWNGASWQSGFVTTSATVATPGSATTSWSSSFNPPQDGGNYYVWAVAIDTNYNYTVSPYVLFTLPDAVAPSATLTPANDATVNGSLVVSGTSTDNNAVYGTYVAIYRVATSEYWNGTSWQAGASWIPTAVATPGSANSTYTYSLDPPPGDYLIGALPIDANYNYAFVGWNKVTVAAQA
jgi:Putative Ig domain/Bacterial Ig domain/Regulator of chromosome condensation (RCC1) repeat